LSLQPSSPPVGPQAPFGASPVMVLARRRVFTWCILVQVPVPLPSSVPE
jgi:hypothetical protein